MRYQINDSNEGFFFALAPFFVVVIIILSREGALGLPPNDISGSSALLFFFSAVVGPFRVATADRCVAGKPICEGYARRRKWVGRERRF